ncbi:hypothetical protein MSG28_006023 [Choristoneura fumiferana]|uniref:Uncharacterized protein n=1 Tax=Choristoneura fumiferana TaxID=7141 RepID=A0ACC0L2A1_CHOFU|nr:hypothetical protein MSG28_006023 [Choristoneura fumiferana]
MTGAEYFSRFLAAANSAAAPAVSIVRLRCEAANVLTYVAFQSKHLPLCHGIKVSPSGLFPPVRQTPGGSSTHGILADIKALRTPDDIIQSMVARKSTQTATTSRSVMAIVMGFIGVAGIIVDPGEACSGGQTAPSLSVDVVDVLGWHTEVLPVAWQLQGVGEWDADILGTEKAIEKVEMLLDDIPDDTRLDFGEWFVTRVDVGARVGRDTDGVEGHVKVAVGVDAPAGFADFGVVGTRATPKADLVINWIQDATVGHRPPPIDLQLPWLETACIHREPATLARNSEQDGGSNPGGPCTRPYHLQNCVLILLLHDLHLQEDLRTHVRHMLRRGRAAGYWRCQERSLSWLYRLKSNGELFKELGLVLRGDHVESVSLANCAMLPLVQVQRLAQFCQQLQVRLGAMEDIGLPLWLIITLCAAKIKCAVKFKLTYNNINEIRS